MTKLCHLSKFFLPTLLLLALTAILAAPAPANPSAPTGWQLIITTPQGTSTLPLCTDFTEGDTARTLEDPLIPLRPLATALGLNLDFQQIDGVAAALWPAADAYLLLAGHPTAIHIYNEEKNNEKTTTNNFSAETLPLFDVPQIFNGAFCVPVSFLDVLGLDYTIDAARQQITLQSESLTAAPAADLWSAAQPRLNYLLTPRRHLLAAATLPINSTDSNDTARANSLLAAAGALHATCIPPGDSLPTPADSLLAQTLSQAAQAAHLPQIRGHFINDTIFPLQIACQLTAGTLTVRIFQLNSDAAALDYLGPIAQ